MTKPGVMLRAKYPVRPDICWDRQQYVMGVIGRDGRLSLRQRVLDDEDANILAYWIERKIARERRKAGKKK